MAKTLEIPFKISSSNLSKIISILKDLSIIHEKSLFRFDKKNLLIYSLVGEGTGINAFKSYTFKIDDILDINLDEFNVSIDFIAKDIKNIYRNLQIMVDMDKDISGKLYYDEIGDKYYSDRLFFKVDSKLKLNFYSSDPMSFNTNITSSHIKKLTNIDNSEFNFDLKVDDFNNIKKLSTTNKDSDVFFMNTFEKDDKYYISIGESSWDLTLGEISDNITKTLSFPKKYLKVINVQDISKVYVFDRFLMIKTDESNLLISTEITV
ncbi:MAG: hypothetical protein WDA02_02300 [Saccharofermentanales bacterium]|jgi:hypothetical protein